MPFVLAVGVLMLTCLAGRSESVTKLPAFKYNKRLRTYLYAASQEHRGRGRYRNKGVLLYILLKWAVVHFPERINYTVLISKNVPLLIVDIFAKY